MVNRHPRLQCHSHHKAFFFFFPSPSLFFMLLCHISPWPYMKHGAKAPWRSRQCSAVLLLVPNHAFGKQQPQHQAKDWFSSPAPKATQ